MVLASVAVSPRMLIVQKIAHSLTFCGGLCASQLLGFDVLVVKLFDPLIPFGKIRQEYERLQREKEEQRLEQITNPSVRLIRTQ